MSRATSSTECGDASISVIYTAKLFIPLQFLFFSRETQVSSLTNVASTCITSMTLMCVLSNVSAHIVPTMQTFTKWPSPLDRRSVEENAPRAGIAKVEHIRNVFYIKYQNEGRGE